jgi:hypothetical protein
VRYRANTVGALRAQAGRCELEVVELRAIGDPTYLAVNDVMFRASAFGERLMPRGWGVHLIGDFVRP